MTERDAQIIEMAQRDPTPSLMDIGLAVGITRQGVAYILKRHGVKKARTFCRSLPQMRKHNWQLVADLAHQGFYQLQIAQKLGCHHGRVTEILQALGIKVIDGRYHRMLYPQLWDYRFIVSTLGMRAEELAKHQGCCRAIVYRARRRFGFGRKGKGLK